MSHARIGLIVVCTATAGMAWLSAQTLPGSKPIRGFSAASSALELQRERELKASPSPKTASRGSFAIPLE